MKHIINVLTIFFLTFFYFESATPQDVTAILSGNTSNEGFSVINAAGDTLMRVTGEGNVGIGTSNPAGPLDVQGGIVDWPTIPNGLPINIIGQNGAGGNGGDVNISSGRGEPFGGSVNISTVGSNFTGNINLTTASSNVTGGAINLTTGYSNGGGNTISLNTGNSDSGNNDIILQAGNQGNISIAAGDNAHDPGGDITLIPGTGLSGDPDGFVIVDGVSSFRGNVGIGTTNPAGPLDVQGGIADWPTIPNGLPINIIGQDGAGGNGGDVNISAGPSGALTGGSVQINGGSGQDAGDIIITTSSSNTSGGAINLSTGFSNGGGNGISLTTGNTSAGGNDITLTPGTGSPDGLVVINGSGTYSGTWTQSSDIRYKKDIEYLDVSLANLTKLQGVMYNWRVDEYPDNNFSEDRQIGLIAQEIEKIYPQIVKTNSEGFKSVDYAKLSVVLLEAVKQQQTLLEKQSEIIDGITKRLVNIEQRIGNEEVVLNNVEY
jgi:hypothetical protein